MKANVCSKVKYTSETQQPNVVMVLDCILILNKLASKDILGTSEGNFGVLILLGLCKKVFLFRYAYQNI